MKVLMDWQTSREIPGEVHPDLVKRTVAGHGNVNSGIYCAHRYSREASCGRVGIIPI